MITVGDWYFCQYRSVLRQTTSSDSTVRSSPFAPHSEVRFHRLVDRGGGSRRRSDQRVRHKEYGWLSDSVGISVEEVEDRNEEGWPLVLVRFHSPHPHPFFVLKGGEKGISYMYMCVCDIDVWFTYIDMCVIPCLYISHLYVSTSYLYHLYRWNWGSAETGHKGLRTRWERFLSFREIGSE